MSTAAVGGGGAAGAAGAAPTGASAPAGQASPPGGEMPSSAGQNNAKKGPVVEHKGQPSPSAGKAPGQPKPEARPDWWKKLDLKMGESSESLEFESPDQLVDRMRRERAQNLAWQRKNSQIEARAKALEAAAGDPIAAARALNPDFDFDQEAIRRVSELYQLEQMDPKDRALQEREAKLAEYERREQERQRAELEAQAQQVQEANRARWQKKILEAIDEVAGESDGNPDEADYKATVLLPAVAGVLFHARQMNPEGDPDLELSPKEVAHEVRRLHGRTFERNLSRASIDKVLPVVGKQLDAMDDATLLSKLGPQRIARIVKAHLDQTNGVRNAPAPAPEPVADKSSARGTDDERNRLLGIKGRAPPRL